jgi:tetratricopeptide (TPR) repeat protein
LTSKTAKSGKEERKMRNGRTGTGKRIFQGRPLFFRPVVRFLRLSPLSCLFFLILACSSAPQRPVEMRSLRNLGESQLDIANQEMDRSNYDDALVILEDTWRIAVSSDDPSLRIRTALSMGNAFFSLGRREEAYAVWRDALEEARILEGAGGGGELHAVCLVFIARADLLSAIRAAAGDADYSTEGAPDPGTTARQVRLEVAKAIGVIKDRLYTAFAWMVISMADKELGSYKEAEDAARRALSIHEKARYLEQAAFDWYFIASIRSVAGNYGEAVQALTEAIKFDRRAENTYGLATDWRALAGVYKKAGQTGASEAAYRRSADIFRSMGAEDRVADPENRTQQ